MTGRARKDRSVVKEESAKLFFEAIRSKYTRESYERRLIVFLSAPGMPIDGFVAKAKADPSWAQKVILDCLLGEKQRYLGKEIQAASVRNKLKPLKLLLEMNDVAGINWKKISR